MPGLNEVMKALGVGLPFLYAAGTYYLFHRLDMRASGPAKKAFSDWFTRRYDRSEVASAVVEVFDRVYTRPLFGWRAFLRSLALTLLTAVIFVEMFFPMIFPVARSSAILVAT
ncbi:hypothetical protein [Bradyrhizobium roseum]|uniref:hypothetical protein n=1 Tax=Bradyrhizobium roseum TaxID=3056648 RepID=UPI00262542D6|nr:hypothetical protein [Bradyrhizobium roseus]WKA29813.1 hypothetical protein QUH67_06460 [Bradyrhizobium roseus]